MVEINEIVLNEEQQAAEDAIFAAYDRGEQSFRLEGSAGVGKTFLMQSVCRRFSQKTRRNSDMKISVVATAPTHKAVQVLATKFKEAGLLNIELCTIHSLLGLKPTVSDSEKQVLKRNPATKSRAGFVEVVVIDECSMVGTDLQKFIDSDLTFHFVLYVGDRAQLPPVGEEIAPCFLQVPERNSFKLHKIVRQAEGNPILQAATQLRLLQAVELSKVFNWDWSTQAISDCGQFGIYHCGPHANEWMREAFTSAEFQENNDAFRYIAYTNARVKEINQQIRYWIYGRTDTPFVAGERVLCRNPVLNSAEKPVFSTNEEAIVTSIQPDTKTFSFSMLGAAAGQLGFAPWGVELKVWKIGLRRPTYDFKDTDDDNDFEMVNGSDGTLCYAYVVQDELEYLDLERKVSAQAKANRNRWREFFAMKESVADIRSVYALTAHGSQGSTFGVAFVDVGDIAMRLRTNLQEAKKLYYVALTRASKGVVLTGI